MNRRLRIVSTPDVLNGEPHIEATRVPTRSIAIRFKRGESLADIAASYDVPVVAVEDALRFELADSWGVP
jgi:uncharacterized protein (DUF433 family)